MKSGKSCIFICMLLLSTGLKALSFEFVFVDNNEGDFESRGWLETNSLFQRNFIAAGALWGARIDSDEVLLVEVKADRTVTRAGGTFTNGRFLSIDMDGVNVFEPGPLSKVLSGFNPGRTETFNFELRISLDATFFDQFYVLDSIPESRIGMVAEDRTDFILVLMHEMGHALGIAGERIVATSDDPEYGFFPRGFKSVFDSLTAFSGNGALRADDGELNDFLFSGTTSSTIYGALVPIANIDAILPLATQNFYHLGDCDSTDILKRSLMNGCSLPNGERLYLTALDLALLTDMGYPTIPVVADFVPSINALRIPFLDAGELGIFQIQLTLIEAQAIEFILEPENILAIPLGTAMPTTLDGSMVSIPRLEVPDIGGVSVYQIDLEILGGNPLRLRLDSFTLLDE